MITHTEFFNRAMKKHDIASVWTVEDLCGKDLDIANDEYALAYERYKKAKFEYESDKNASNLSKKNWAEVEKLRAELRYYEKYAVYCEFMES